MSETKYGKYILSDLKKQFSKEDNEEYAQLAKRVLWIDDEIVPGSFQMNVSWYIAPKQDPAIPHTHKADEILGFFGGDPENPNDLGGEIEIWLEDEQHILTQSSMIFIPGGMKHCPLIIRRVDRPILHFSTVTSGAWDFEPAD